MKYREKEDLIELIELYNRITRIKSFIIFHYDIEELREIFKSCFFSIEAAGGVVKNKNGEILFIYRRGKWDLPKGKLDDDETFQQAALREVTEETGLSHLTILKPLIATYHTYPYKGQLALKKTLWFEMTFDGDEPPIPQSTEDIEEVRWFKENELFIPFQNTYGLIKDVFTYMGLKF